MIRLVLVASALITMGTLLGCAARTPAPVQEGSRGVPDTYVVVRGDTLSAIAWRYELDWQDVARWNRLRNPDLIYPGQRLLLRPAGSSAQPVVASASPSPPPAPQAKAPPRAREPVPREAPASEGMPTPAGERVAQDVKWRWPTEGKVVRSFKPEVPGRKGIQIGGDLGQAVRPASSGRVVYSGSGLPGYGRLIIVKHSDTLLSAYGYLGEIFVSEGDRVTWEQPIAEMGTGNDNRPVLHFEIRQNGKPVNPLQFLPG